MHKRRPPRASLVILALALALGGAACASSRARDEPPQQVQLVRAVSAPARLGEPAYCQARRARS
jgi:hypothetical protein